MPVFPAVCSEVCMDKLISKIVEWAQHREDIRALIVIGSRARQNHPADQWSDLDLVIVTDDPAYYLQHEDWLAEIATPLITFIEQTATDKGQERRVLFEGAQ